VIYTSGSTGKPKGVLLEHQGLCNLVEDHIQTLEIHPSSRVLQFASFSFDGSLFEIFTTLSAGATLCLARRESLLPGPALLQLLQDQAITHIAFPPSVLSILPDEELPALKTIVSAGEACSTDIVKRWAKGRRFFNAYGPSEATITTTITEYGKNCQRLTIGRPIANKQVYLLDAHLQPVPVGVPGELCISGVGLARGYLNRPDLTAEKFISNHLGEKPGKRIYKTGDLAKYLPDGSINYLGRIDRQVKLRGFRIELSEIEASLKQHQAVREATVMVREDVPGDRRLAAYVVPMCTREVTSGELRNFLRGQLPEYMVPSVFVILDALPLTPNGKVEHRALPTINQLRTETRKNFTAPRTTVERILVRIWNELLNLEQVSIYDNFFEIGGYSLLVTQLLARVQQVFQVNIRLQIFFQSPTIAALAESIEKVHHTGAFDVSDSATTTDLDAEATLDSTICLNGLRLEYVSEPAHILLTGATGFLGAFLLHQLLQKTQANIYFLVRAQNAKEAKNRIQRSLESYLIWNESFSSRIIPITGDLSHPLLGLTTEQFQLLASKVDVIYHNAAQVSFTYPYSALKKPNVFGTQEILRLASQIKVKPMHFISTLSVFPLEVNYGSQLIREDDSLDHGQKLYGGYTQSKWVAEKLLFIARSRGIPISVYRPVRIIGHSQTGAYNKNDFIYRMLLGCIQLGSAPDCDVMLNMLPVDYVAEAIIYLSQQEKSLGKNFHLANSKLISWNELVDWLNIAGYSLKKLPYEQWREKLLDFTKFSRENVLYNFLPIFSEGVSQEQIFDSVEVKFDCQNTSMGLAGTSVECPPIDPTFLERSLSITDILVASN